METTIEKLEAMFLKSEADLEYIEKRLKLDFINNIAENGSATEENPAVMLEKLKAIKAKHSILCSQVHEIAAAQKQTMNSIRNDLGSVMDLINHFQKTTNAERDPTPREVWGPSKQKADWPKFSRASVLPTFNPALTEARQHSEEKIDPLSESEQKSVALLTSPDCLTTSEDHKPSLLVNNEG